MTPASPTKRVSRAHASLPRVERLGSSHALLCSLVAVLQALVGIVSGSKMLCVAAVLSLHAGLSAATLRMAVRGDRQGPSATPSYDSGKLQLAIVAAGSATVLLAVTALGGSLVHSWLAHHQRVPSVASGAMGIGSAVVMALLLRRAGDLHAHRSHPLLRQHGQLLLAAALAAVAVIGSVLLARLWGPYVDSVLAVLAAGAVVLLAGWSLARSMRGLLDESVPPGVLRGVRKLVGKIDRQAVVRSIRGTRAGHRVSFALVVELPATMLMGEAALLQERIVETIQRRYAHLDGVLVSFRPPEAEGPRGGCARAAEDP